MGKKHGLGLHTEQERKWAYGKAKKAYDAAIKNKHYTYGLGYVEAVLDLVVEEAPQDHDLIENLMNMRNELGAQAGEPWRKAMQMGAGGAFFSKQDMSDLLVTAWEGGSTYWLRDAEYVAPSGMTHKELRKAAWEAAPESERNMWKDEGPTGWWPLYMFLPFLPPSVKWKIKFRDYEGGEKVYLTPENMREAASKMAKEYPKLFAAVKDGDFDAGVADVWLQMAMLGEVVYG